ncbi:MAG: hypothetical protein OXU61_08595 [Gammaproteobacteria bacterium]|nr:hypothetical protein [Gammaproteobacteria bacterium]
MRRVLILKPGLEGRGLSAQETTVPVKTVFIPMAGVNGKGLGETRVVGSDSLASFRPGAVRPARIGTLKRFVGYLQANGLVGMGADPRSVDVQRSIQKYAYIAEGMGASLGYDFEFLESGAFSTEMSIDMYRLDLARGGKDPFEGDADASEAFLQLVGEKGKMWLRVATFVIKTMGTIHDVDAFVKYMEREGPMYDKRTVRNAFERIRPIAEAGDGQI